ncbi:MAG TPA: hypothetical protein VF199_10130 [Bacillales bacterium]
MRLVWLCFAFIGAFLSFISFKKFSELKGITPDGDGIGVYFLGMEINDHVPNENIMEVAYQFLGVSAFFTLLTLFCLAGLVFHKKMVKRWSGKNEAR